MTEFHRRRLLKAGGLAAALPTRIFAQTSAASRPRLAQGVQSGDVMRDGAIVWSRADRPSRMFVEYATTEAFVDAKRIAWPLALEETDFTELLRDHYAPSRVFPDGAAIEAGRSAAQSTSEFSAISAIGPGS